MHDPFTVRSVIFSACRRKRRDRTGRQPAQITYTVTNGGHTAWTRGSKQDITIIVKRSEDDASCFSHFRNVRIDGKLLEKDKDYTAVSGSTIVTVKAETLEALADGRHTITLEFDDGKAETSLTIAAKDSRRSPDTSDPDNMIWLFALLASLAAAAALRHMEKAL